MNLFEDFKVLLKKLSGKFAECRTEVRGYKINNRSATPQEREKIDRAFAKMDSATKLMSEAMEELFK